MSGLGKFSRVESNYDYTSLPVSFARRISAIPSSEAVSSRLGTPSQVGLDYILS